MQLQLCRSAWQPCNGVCPHPITHTHHARVDPRDTRHSASPSPDGTQPEGWAFRIHQLPSCVRARGFYHAAT
jgi:hypothetical protein